MLSFLVSQKGTRKLVYGEFMFTKERKGSGNKEIWRCETRTCHARLHTQEDQVIQETGQHNHAAVHGKSNVERVRADIKQRATESEEPTRQIVQLSLTQLPLHYAHLIPSADTLSRSVRRARQIGGPNNDDLNQYRLTVGNEQFIRIEELDMIIFAADSDLQFLSNCRHWFADGTFRVTPSQFDQLYTIHGFLNGKVYPCIYALLPGRSSAVYTRFWNHVVDLIPNPNPASITTDFEYAAIQSLQLIFPGTSISGCSFHLGQSVWRKVQEERLVQRYNTDVNFSSKIRSLLALAFVPVVNVINIFEQLTGGDNMEGAEAVCDYFEDNYIGTLRRGRRTVPRFPIALWNQYDRVINDLPRSNNAVEGWHQAFNNMLVIAHPSTPRLARKLRQEQHSAALSRRQIELGQSLPKKKKKYVQMTAALKTIASDYNNRDSQQYLSDIARILNINVT